MKRKFTGEQFIELVDKGKWKRSQDICDSVDSLVKHFTGDGETYEVVKCCGNAYKVSELDGIEIHYKEDYSYIEYMPHSFQSSPIEYEWPWSLEDAYIVDEDGDKLSISEVSDFLAAVCDENFSTIDYSSIHEKLEETMDIDIDEKDKKNRNNFRYIKVDYAPDIRFKGSLFALVKTNDMVGHSAYSGEPGRWDDWRIYKTKSRKFVCSRIKHTLGVNMTDSYKGKVCENEKEVIEFFGHCQLAKELYEQAGIDDVIDVQ